MMPTPKDFVGVCQKMDSFLGLIQGNCEAVYPKPQLQTFGPKFPEVEVEKTVRSSLLRSSRARKSDDWTNQLFWKGLKD